ncbi:MAG: TolC family protein [Pirellulales bacterium]|nr:TolC family protein [Pirellulales bacterium]
MSRRLPHLATAISWALLVLSGLVGCHPQQPVYLFDDGDLSHYLDVATEIEYPDVEQESLGDVDGAVRPFSLGNSEPSEIWDLSLEEAVQIALANSKVMRSLGGLVSSGGQTLSMPDTLVRGSPVRTVFDPAIAETNPRFGVEAALSAFDAQFSGGVVPVGGSGTHGWSKVDQPRNNTADIEAIFSRVSQEDNGGFEARVSKRAATGGVFSFTHDLLYTDSNSPIRRYPSDWTTQLRGEFTQPLLQGAGVQYNRISGPGAIPGYNNGVMIARINTDISLADFEAGVRDLVNEVEVAYWNLYLAYRSLDAVVAGRDSGLQTWRQIYTKFVIGTGDAAEEAQARNQYFLFRRAVEEALNNLYKAESNLRYIIGLAATDGRLIRPADEPTAAKVVFDWYDSHAEALSRSVELREQRWLVKRRELELIAAKNYLLPRLDFSAMYQWQGLGNKLIESSGGTGDPFVTGSNSYQSMFHGDYQNWGMGLEFSLPIGFRKELAGVRHAQLNLAREKALLQEMELEVSHQLAWSVRNAEANVVLSQTNFNRRIAAQDEVKTAEAKYEAGVVEGTLDRVLDAQRRLAEAESDYYNTLVEYNKSIAQVHFRKGSLLEYNGVYLAEGPWPGKAYFDARRRARARDAGFYLDYGFTRPKVVSRGAYQQHASAGEVIYDGEYETEEGMPERIPTPAPEPLGERPDSLKPAPAPPKPLQSEPMASATVEESQPAEPQPDKGPELADRWSPIESAVFRRAAEKAEAPGAVSSKKTAENKWAKSESSGTWNESVAIAPAAGSDRPASGWNGVQR